LRTVRFNFRGVGASAGSFTRGVGETQDTLAVLHWVREYRPRDQLWLAGFSFGAYMALRAADRFPVARLILVAPPVQLYPELGAPPVPTAPLLVLHGEEDDVVPLASVQAWLAALASTPTVHVFPGAGHFFHGRLSDLRRVVETSLRPAVPN
jgi:alpha/beta superfamily hydrolase